MHGGSDDTGDAPAFGPFSLLVAERVLLKDGNAVTLGGRAFDLLHALVSRAGDVVSVRQLCELVWPNMAVGESNVRGQVNTLRKVLQDGKDGIRYIVNVPGRGYAFSAPVRYLRHKPLAGDTRAIDTTKAPVRPRHLPAAPLSVIGRDQTVSALSELLLARRFLSVVGPGGIGKTTVALSVAHAMRHQFDDSLFFVDFSTSDDPADVPAAIASALGCFVTGPDTDSYISAFLAEKRILLVLDNCEHVVEGVARLSERVWRENRFVHILATSREALRVQGENVHLLAPLAYPTDDSPSASVALASPAVQLFMSKAAAGGHSSELQDVDAPAVARMCRRLDGLPLAIELVASRVGSYGIQGTIDLLDSGAEIVLRGRRNALPRHQTLQAMINWSVQLLSGDEQRIFTRLSIFAQRFGLSSYAVVGDSGTDGPLVASVVANLIDKSLVTVEQTADGFHFRLLDTTRAYAAARLARSGEADLIARRHARFFTALLRTADIEGSVLDGRNLATYAHHLGDVRKALAWCLGSEDDRVLAVELAAYAVTLLLGLSLLAECQDWCERALEALRNEQKGTLVELKLLEGAAVSSMYLGGSTRDIDSSLQRGLSIAQSLGDRHHQLYILSGMAHFGTRKGDFGGALEAARQCAALIGPDDHPTRHAMSAWLLVATLHLTGDHAGAVRRGRRAHQSGANLEPAWGTFFDFGHNVHGGYAAFAQSLWLSGHLDEGYRVACEALDRLSGSEHPVPLCVSILFCAPVLLWSGDAARAKHHIDRAVESAARYSLPSYRAMGLALTGEIELAGGRVQEGVAMLREALTTMEASRYAIVTLSTLRAYAEGLAACRRPVDALAVITDALDRTGQVGSTLHLPELLRARGEILLAQAVPQASEAEACLLRSVSSARAQSALSRVMQAAVPLARLWREQGRVAEARSLLSGTYSRFTEGFSTRLLADVRREIALLDAI